MKDYLISVIIPVYNAEKFLSAAIESVIAQTYKEWELILVDDGSSDQSVMICDQYAKLRGKQIRIIHQNNQGVGAARNIGLDVAKGEFITFMDADDVIFSEFLQTLCSRQKETGADMAGTWFEYVDINLLSIDCNKVTHEHCCTSEDMHLFAKKNPVFFGTACGKLFRKSLIDAFELRFSTELCRGEDTLFTCSFASVCKTIASTSKKQYYYRIYDYSSTGKTENIWLEQAIQVVEKFMAFSEKNRICSKYVLNTAQSMRADILGDFMKIQTSVSNMRNYLDVLHSSECFQKYIRHHKPDRRIVMLLYTYIMLYSPKKAQPYIFTALNRWRGAIKSFCSRLRSIHFFCE